MAEYTRASDRKKWKKSKTVVITTAARGCGKAVYVDPNRPAFFISLHRKLTRRERVLQWLRDRR